MKKSFKVRHLLVLLVTVAMLVGMTAVSVSAETVKNVKIDTPTYVSVEKNKNFTLEGSFSGQGISRCKVVAKNTGVTVVDYKVTWKSYPKACPLKITAKVSKPGKLQVQLFDAKGNLIKKKNTSIGVKQTNYYAETTAKSGLRIRKTPVDGATVGYYDYGTLVQVQAIYLGSDGNQWARTSKGYVCMAYLKKVTCYKVTYNGNGDNVKNLPTAQVAKANSTFKLSATKPTRSGYQFLGWSTNKNATTATCKPGVKVTIKGNATLYAVWKKIINPTSVSLNHTSLTMTKGSTKQLTATVNPSNASDKSVSWSSSNKAVATVSSKGVVTAKKPGNATITVKTSNGKTKACKVTVKGIVINAPSSLVAGDIQWASATAYPADTKKFTWSTSNKKVLTVDSKGKLTAKKAGTVTITAKTSDGRTASVTITVKKAELWRTGRFDSGYVAKGYTSVRLNQNAGDGYITIHSYNSNDKETKADLHVTLRDTKGNWIWEGDIKSNTKLRLGADHDEYRVYVAKKKYNNDSANVKKCYYWGIECKSNCYID